MPVTFMKQISEVEERNVYVVYNYLYSPEAYLTHFSYRCWFLNCSAERGEWRGGGEEYAIYFLGPSTTRFARCHFRAPKMSRFSGPTPSNSPCMDVAHIKILTSRAISKTDTVIQKPAGDGRSDDPPTPPTAILFHIWSVWIFYLKTT
jgi:hypothetical protein